MLVNARVIESGRETTSYAVLDGKGNCSSGKCEGCQCGTKMKIITLPSDPEGPLPVGQDVEIHQDATYLIHFFLIILLPLIVLGGILFLPSLITWIPAGESLNALALTGGLITFILTALLIRRYGKKKNLRVVPVN